MKSASKHAAALDACFEELRDFTQSDRLGTVQDNRYASYLLDGSQVGSVRLLLHIASQLRSENEELAQQSRAKEQELTELQKVVDASISYL